MNKPGKNDTFCYLLWERAYINEYGDVYFCCLCKPEPIGNIYEHDLTYIWQKSKKAELLRGMSLNGSLSCYSGCTVLSKKEKEFAQERKNAGSDYPRNLQIMVGTFCPISCIMCPQDHRLKIALDNVTLERNIDWPRINDIIIQGGEVLAISNAKELLIWLTDKMQKKIKLVTNGLLINHEWAERLIRNSEWIEISVNAASKKTHELVNRGSDFDKVIRNTKMLIALKRTYNIKTEIRYHFTIVPENVHEIAQAIKFADGLGCGLMTYCFDSPNTENFLSQHQDLRARLKDELSKVIHGNLNIKVQRNHLEQLGLIDDFSSGLFVDNY
jgi:MoaA/NifB/PqqE/SkfB family radical SAM enzyme